VPDIARKYGAREIGYVIFDLRFARKFAQTDYKIKLSQGKKRRVSKKLSKRWASRVSRQRFFEGPRKSSYSPFPQLLSEAPSK
jgi:hypothetical protein